MIRRLAVILLAVCLLSAADCNRSGSSSASRRRSVVAEPLKATPSSSVPVVPGSGLSWSPGAFTQAPFGNPLLHQHINPHRQKKGLPSLAWHDGLAGVAMIHSSDMVVRKYKKVTSPEGWTIATRLVSSMPAMTFTDTQAAVDDTPGNAKQIFDSLMTDGAMRKTIENAAMTHFGAWFTNNPGGKGTVIIGQNVLP